jgi:hypothetical protein
MDQKQAELKGLAEEQKQETKKKLTDSAGTVLAIKDVVEIAGYHGVNISLL